jgi:hypothetical protein
MKQVIIKVNVTEEHIRRGKKGECSLCPIALALQDQVPYSMVSVGCNKMTYYPDPELRGHWMVAETPEKVSEAILDFDADGKMTPFSFTVTFEKVNPLQ